MNVGMPPRSRNHRLPVTQVLLANDWHIVADASLEVGPHEYSDPRWRRPPRLGPQQPEAYEIGFSFKQQDGSFIAGPISSVRAVRRGR